VLDCASSLSSSEYEILIGTFSGGIQKTSAYSDEAVRRGLRIVRIVETSPLDWRIIAQVLRIIDEEGVGLIHTHDFRSNIVGLLCGRRRGIPIVSTVHGWIANDVKGRIYCAVDRWLLRFFDHIIAVSEKTRDRILEGCSSCTSLTVIPNALRLETYVPRPDDRGFRAEIGVDDHEVLIATIGRLSAEKGQLVFLEAAEMLTKERGDLRFVLIGVGPDQDTLDAFVRERRLEKYVKFAGFRTDMVRVYNSIDIVVQSSYTEGMPNVILEALLMCVPVVATDVGGTAEVLEHGRAGLLVPPGSPSELARAVSEVLVDSRQSKKRAEDGRLWVTKNFDHEQRVRRLKKVYDSFS
jgi:glycosyltransferase involved in cell wall biosynthesis